MKAIARLVWTYLTALPILRWVGGVALATLPFAVLGIWPRTRGFIALPMLAFGIHSLSMTIAAGYLFRVLSSPRSHGFLPHFRGRSLAAFLAIVAVVSAPWLVIVAWAALRPPYAVTLVVPLFIMIAMVGFAFFPVGAAVALTSLLAIGWLVTRLGSPHPAVVAAPPDIVHIDLSAFDIAVLLLCVWAAIWIAFSIWYLRVRRVEPIQTPAMILERIGISPGARSVVFDRGKALEASLAGAYPQGAKQILLWAAFLVIGSKIAGGAVDGMHLPLYTAHVFLFFPGLIIPGTLLAAVATMHARRTRSVWLRSGLSRRGLLAAIEKQIWWRAAPGAIAVSVVLSTGIALGYDVPMPALARALVSAGATALLAVYLGVAFVRDSRLVEICVAAVLIASACVGAWTALSGPEHSTLWLATILSQAAAALAFRAIAIAQWRKIDWLVFKPARIWSQSLR
jgi:hypothetical protein